MHPPPWQSSSGFITTEDICRSYLCIDIEKLNNESCRYKFWFEGIRKAGTVEGRVCGCETSIAHRNQRSGSARSGSTHQCQSYPDQWRTTYHFQSGGWYVECSGKFQHSARQSAEGWLVIPEQTCWFWRSKDGTFFGFSISFHRFRFQCSFFQWLKMNESTKISFRT